MFKIWSQLHCIFHFIQHIFTIYRGKLPQCYNFDDTVHNTPRPLPTMPQRSTQQQMPLWALKISTTLGFAFTLSAQGRWAGTMPVSLSPSAEVNDIEFIDEDSPSPAASHAPAPPLWQSGPPPSTAPTAVVSPFLLPPATALIAVYSSSCPLLPAVLIAAQSLYQSASIKKSIVQSTEPATTTSSTIVCYVPSLIAPLSQSGPLPSTTPTAIVLHSHPPPHATLIAAPSRCQSASTKKSIVKSTEPAAAASSSTVCHPQFPMVGPPSIINTRMSEKHSQGPVYAPVKWTEFCIALDQSPVPPKLPDIGHSSLSLRICISVTYSIPIYFIHWSINLYMHCWSTAISPSFRHRYSSTSHFNLLLQLRILPYSFISYCSTYPSDLRCTAPPPPWQPDSNDHHLSDTLHDDRSQAALMEIYRNNINMIV